MQVSTEIISTWPNDLLKKAMDNNGIEHMVRILPVLLCPKRYSNDGKYKSEDCSLKTEQLKKPKDSNVQVCRGRSPSSSQHLTTIKFRGGDVQLNFAHSGQLLLYHRSKYEVHR